MAEKEYLTLDEIKECQLRLLDLFDAFCKKHNLTYWIAFGSLIGARRHQGYIPWDDDLDVMMPKDDYDRFEELAQSEDGNAYFKENIVRVAGPNIQNGIPYHQTFIKLYDERTRASKGLLAYDREGFKDAVFMDVFCLLGNDCTQATQDRYDEMCEAYRFLRYASEDLAAVRKVEGRARFKRRLLGYIPSRIKGYRYYLDWYERIRREFPDPRECDFSFAPEGDLVKYPVAKDEKTIYLPFEGRMVPVPEHYDEMLRMCYGDYMQLPPEDERVQTHAQDFWWLEDRRPSK